MKEEFLYYLWKFRKFNAEDLKTSEGEEILLIQPGTRNEHSGPDFFNAKIKIGNQLWAGNVEMHLKSSDWYLHQHETDSNYDNVILHVVWEHDVEIYRKNSTTIPTLELRKIVDLSALSHYRDLLEKPHSKINCEDDFGNFSNFQMNHWLERLYFERLETKAVFIQKVLHDTGNNWEATCFILISRSFGLNINGETFQAIAQSFNFTTIQKLQHDQFRMEALLLGQSKLIKGQDKYALKLRQEYDFLKVKFQLSNEELQTPEFFRLRPDNFPVLRLVQLAALYAQNPKMFQRVVKAVTMQEIQEIFEFSVSEYWKTHYNFSSPHKERDKRLSKKFIDLLVINCIIPLKFIYARHTGTYNNQDLIELISGIKSEQNATVKLYNQLRPKTATNAMQSQSLLQLKSKYCNPNNCLHCELGASLLNKSRKYA